MPGLGVPVAPWQVGALGFVGGFAGMGKANGAGQRNCRGKHQEGTRLILSL